MSIFFTRHTLKVCRFAIRYNNEEVDKIVNNEIQKPTNYIQNTLSFNEKRNIAKLKYDEIKELEIIQKIIQTNVLLPQFGPHPWFSHGKNRTASIALHRLRSGHNHLNTESTSQGGEFARKRLKKVNPET